MQTPVGAKGKVESFAPGSIAGKPENAPFFLLTDPQRRLKKIPQVILWEMLYKRLLGYLYCCLKLTVVWNRVILYHSAGCYFAG